MAKIDGQAVGKYLALGAGAVALPAIAANITQLSTILAKIPFWDQAMFGITIGGLVLAALGVGIVDQLMNK